MSLGKDSGRFNARIQAGLGQGFRQVLGKGSDKFGTNDVMF